MSETLAPPAAETPPGGIRPLTSLPPNEGRSIDNALAEMQRRRNAEAPPASQAVATTPPSPWQSQQAPALPPPDAVMPGAEQPPPVSQSTGTAPADLVVQLEIDGALVPVTIHELQLGYLREQDYRRKSQALAQEQRRYQDQHQQLAAVRQALEARLPAYAAHFANEFSQPVDWERLSREDPIGTGQKVARLLAYQQTLAEQQNLERARAQEEHGRKQQLHAIGHDVLSRVIPGWADPPTRQVIQQALRAHAISMGWTAQEVDRAELLDPRDVYLAWKSMNYDRLMGQRIVPQPAGMPTYSGNGVRRVQGTPTLADAEERFRQTHRMEDAVAVAAARREMDGRQPVTPPPLTSRYR